jgi:hypothetical protein
MLRSPIRVALVILAPVLACSQPQDAVPETTWVRVVGMIDSGGVAPGPLVLPTVVHAGVLFEATIATYGGSGCIHPDQSQVQSGVSSADITPYDRIAVSPPCLPDWYRYSRTVQLRFDTPGSATVTLRGRGFGSQELTLQRTITVLP